MFGNSQQIISSGFAIIVIPMFFCLCQSSYLSFTEYRRMFDRVVNMAHLNLDKLAFGSETWGQQFYQAMNVNGGDVEGASLMDYVMHFITFFWKVSITIISTDVVICLKKIRIKKGRITGCSS